MVLNYNCDYIVIMITIMNLMRITEIQIRCVMDILSYCILLAPLLNKNIGHF